MLGIITICCYSGYSSFLHWKFSSKMFIVEMSRFDGENTSNFVDFIFPIDHINPRNSKKLVGNNEEEPLPEFNAS